VSRRPHYPATIAEAVLQLEAQLTPEDRAALLASSEMGLSDHHFGFGLWIRNNLGLHGQNGPLIEELKQALGHPFGLDADAFSAALIELLWERVSGYEGPGVLARGAATRAFYAAMREAWQAVRSGDKAAGLNVLRDGRDQVRREGERLIPGTPAAKRWEVEVLLGWECALEFYCEKYGLSL